jgi:hypothetical protein
LLWITIQTTEPIPGNWKAVGEQRGIQIFQGRKRTGRKTKKINPLEKTWELPKGQGKAFIMMVPGEITRVIKNINAGNAGIFY